MLSAVGHLNLQNCFVVAHSLGGGTALRVGKRCRPPRTIRTPWNRAHVLSISQNAQRAWIASGSRPSLARGLSVGPRQVDWFVCVCVLPHRFVSVARTEELQPGTFAGMFLFEPVRHCPASRRGHAALTSSRPGR